MSEFDTDVGNSPEKSTSAPDTAESIQGMSPYATGGGGITFERKVAVKYLAHLLVGDSAIEFGEDRRVLSVAFQQGPDHPIDDLVISAARHEEPQPSLVLALAVRRSVNLVQSDDSSRKIVRQFVQAVIGAPPVGAEYRLGLIVSGSSPHAEQLSILANLAADQKDAPGFFDLVRTPGKFHSSIRGRLDHLERLVERALNQLNVAEVSTAVVQERTWQLLSLLIVLMPQLESPDETDWSGVLNSLASIVPDSESAAASRLRDRLLALASEYSPRAANVDLTILRRATHSLLDPTLRRHQRGWQTLASLDRLSRESVRAEITDSQRDRSLCLDRSSAVMELIEAASRTEALVVYGDSGVGKSALAVLGLHATSEAKQEDLQALCINLRQIPELPLEFEGRLGRSLATLLCEMSAPTRVLIVDGADAVAEGKDVAFRHLVSAARESNVKLFAISSSDGKHLVLDAIRERFESGVDEYLVPPLSDSELEEVVATFPHLQALIANPRSRILLRRLVVVDLLVRGGVSGVLVSDADAMNLVWSRLVRRRERQTHGSPDSREAALLRLAELELGKGERLEVISGIEPAALDGLRRDGLLRNSPEAPFTIGPAFAHDEIRRYAVARLFLSGEEPSSKLVAAGAPRWSLSAARLACQAWLGQPETPALPLRGRFVSLQASFDAVVGEGHGVRWGDVPGESLLTLTNPEELLKDAWADLRVEDNAGLRRLARLVDQRLRDKNGIVDHVAVEPIIALLLEDEAPWRSGDYVKDLIRGWLRGHVVANTEPGDHLRVLLRARLVEACAAADRRVTEQREAAAAARAARTPDEIERDRQFMEQHGVSFTELGYGGERARRASEVPFELKREIVVELLALLGPDLGKEGAAILLRVARDAPSFLAPAVEEIFTGRSLASYQPKLLAELAESYYIDTYADSHELFGGGVRSHHARSMGVTPLCAWYRGPFMALLQADFRAGVQVLNRLVNHATQFRTRSLMRLAQRRRQIDNDTIDRYAIALNIAGERKQYFGDQHVWRWYRGTGVGPYPCFSALQALERECDQLIKNGTPISKLVSILIEGCESIAMISLAVGLLVRHIESAEELLDCYLTEPKIWELEFGRVVSEASGLAANSEGLTAPERRKCSLREAAMLLVASADSERAKQLRALGEELVANARRDVESMRGDKSSKANWSKEIEKRHIAKVRHWASSLDQSRYEGHKAKDGIHLQVTPPDDVVQSLRNVNEDLKLSDEAIRLFVRYHIKTREERTEVIEPDDLVADISAARKLHEKPPDLHDPWDTPSLVAAAALEANLLDGVVLPTESLSFAVDIVLRVGEGATWPRQYEFEGSLNQQGADRSAARAVPLLLLPGASQLSDLVIPVESDVSRQRVFGAALNLARAEASEVRLNLARGMDHLWKSPCAKNGRCHHDFGWQIVVETMRYCLLGARDPNTMQRDILAVEDPILESLARADGDSIIASRLDAAIRALAPAAKTNICVSSQARDFLVALLSAQRRSLLNPRRSDPDSRSSHTLISARALLTLASIGDDAAIFEHLDEFAENSELLAKLLECVSAAAEETEELAETARRIWPRIIGHVLRICESGHSPTRDARNGERVIASAIPCEAADFHYLYREIDNKWIAWWDPIQLTSEVEAWLVHAAGNGTCVDQIIGFLRVLDPADQVRLGLPWVGSLVAGDPARASRTFLLPSWLIEMRSTAIENGLLTSWQALVDVLVVHGVSRLAPYSE